MKKLLLLIAVVGLAGCNDCSETRYQLMQKDIDRFIWERNQFEAQRDFYMERYFNCAESTRVIPASWSDTPLKAELK